MKGRRASALTTDNPPPAAVEAASAAVPGPEGDLYLPTDVAPETLFQAIGQLRKEAQYEIERLLSFLDATDGAADDRETDADEESEANEPSLGAAEAYGPHTQVDWEKSASNDLEESLGDDEPSLGWTSSGSIGMPLHPSMIDVEDEHDGAERMCAMSSTWGHLTV